MPWAWLPRGNDVGFLQWTKIVAWPSLGHGAFLFADFSGNEAVKLGFTGAVGGQKDASLAIQWEVMDEDGKAAARLNGGVGEF